jgi:3-hydroxyisobutyrate dehydrogenase-like beta-hydroxyacid dehydrogenase
MSVTIIGTGHMACGTARRMLAAELQRAVIIGAWAQAASPGVPLDEVVVLAQARTFSTRYQPLQRNDV